MTAFSDYLMCQELGVLPVVGGWRDQPHSVTLYFGIFRAAQAEAQEQAAKEQ